MPRATTKRKKRRPTNRAPAVKSPAPPDDDDARASESPPTDPQPRAERAPRRPIAAAEVFEVVHAITQQIEDQSGAVSTMLAFCQMFETWWQHEIARALAAAEWHRTPGGSISAEGVELAMEETRKAGDSTPFAKARRKEGKRASSRIDLVVVADPDSGDPCVHLLELKVVGLDNVKKRDARIASMREDMDGMLAVAKSFEPVASGWAVALLFSERERRSVQAPFRGLIRDSRHEPLIRRLKLASPHHCAWVVGLRAVMASDPR